MFFTNQCLRFVLIHTLSAEFISYIMGVRNTQRKVKTMFAWIAIGMSTALFLATAVQLEDERKSPSPKPDELRNWLELGA